MELDIKFILKVVYIMDIIIRENIMDKVHLSGQMVNYIMANGKMGLNMEMDCIKELKIILI